MMQERDPPVGAFSRGRVHRLVDLPAAEKKPAAVVIAAGHPGGIKPGHVQLGAADVDHPLPPRQRLRLAQPVADEVHVGGVAIEHEAPLAVVAK